MSARDRLEARLESRLWVDDNDFIEILVDVDYLIKDYDNINVQFKEFFLDMLGQGCGKYNREKDVMEYDHMCLSTWERGVQMALENGWIQKEQVTR